MAGIGVITGKFGAAKKDGAPGIGGTFGMRDKMVHIPV